MGDFSPRRECGSNGVKRTNPFCADNDADFDYGRVERKSEEEGGGGRGGGGGGVGVALVIRNFGNIQLDNFA